MRRFTVTLLALGLVAVAACGREGTPTAPGEPTAVPGGVAGAAPETSGAAQSGARGKVDICHRTNGAVGYLRLSVSEAALAAHLAHGDARVGDPVPGQPGMRFDGACRPVAPRTVTLTGGYFNRLRVSDPLTLSEPTRVQATATVTLLYPSTSLFRLQLRTFIPVEPVSCGATIREGPAMAPPVVTANWSSVPAGSYCVAPIPLEWGPPYWWTVTLTLTPRPAPSPVALFP